MLQEDTVQEVLARLARGERIKTIARELGVDRHTVKRWRRVVGWAMDAQRTTALTLTALEMALHQRPVLAGLLHHSDRGSQYCSHEFQAVLTGYGMQSSMSRKGNCWDNAPTESLWGSLKVGRLHGMRFETRRQAMDEVIDWLTFYNHRRLHSTLGYISPMQFENNWTAAQLKKAA